MSDKVLHRKLFRQKALKSGKLVPQKAYLGALLGVGRAGLGYLARTQLANRAKQFLAGRTGQMLSGSAKTIEAPLGAYTVAEGMEEDQYGNIDAGTTGLGAAITALGLTDLVPGMRQVRKGLRKVRGGDKLAKGMDESGARARQTTLNAMEKGISRIPGAQKLASAQRKRPILTNIGVPGAAFAAGEGVDVLTEPTPLSEQEQPVVTNEGDPNLDAIEKVDTDKPKTKDVKPAPRDQGPGDSGPFTGGGPPGDLVADLEIEKERRKRVVPQKESAEAAANAVKQEIEEGSSKGNVASKINLKNLSVDESSDILARVNKVYSKSMDAVKEARNKLKDRERESFDDFYGRFKEMTGDSNDKNNMYLLWKFGAALGNARTSQGGLAGVLDSFNQAGASTLETAFGLHQKEQQFRKSLAANFVQYERDLDAEYRQADSALSAEERAIGQMIATTGLNLEEKQLDRIYAQEEKKVDHLNALELARIKKTSKAMNITDLRKVIVPDDSPNNVGGRKIMYIGRSQETGLDLQIAIDPKTGEQTTMPSQLGAPGEGYQELSLGPSELRKAKSSMNQSYGAMKMGQELKELYEQNPEIYNRATGVQGVANDFMNRFEAFATGVLNMTGIAPGGHGSTTSEITRFTDDDAQIIKDFRASASTIEDNMSKEQVANELEKNYRQELARRQTLQFQQGFAKQLGYRNYDKLDDETKNAIAKISVLEHRFKYALANASKEEDRLTQQDVKAAAEKVSFLQMFIDPETVYKRYMNEYMPQMEAKFEQKLQEAREAGITNEFLIAQFPDAKMIRPLAEAVASGKQKVERQSFSQDQLGGILSGQLRTATPIYSDPDVSAIKQGQS